VTPRNVSITLGRPLGATLLLGALLLGALAAVGASWADLSAAGEERDAKADLLERGVAASRRAQVAPAARFADPFVAADSATLAAAAVDSNLRALAAAAGLSLLSNRADAKPDEPGGADAGLGTRIEDQAVVEGPNDALQAFLVRLEGGTPTVLVDGLTIEPAEVDQAALGDPQSPRLRMSLTLGAFWRPGAAAPK
jgi:hypothetical protein